MKKTFLARRNAVLSPAGFSGGVVALGVVLFFLSLRLAFPNFFLAFLSPVFTLGDAVSGSVHSFIAGFEDAKTLATENQTLTEENAALTLQNRTLTEKMADLSPIAPLAGSLVLGVLAHPPQTSYDTLLVQGGTDDGVVVGMAAFGAGGSPLGYVSAASASYTRIILLSSPTQSVSGWVGSTRIPITLHGAGAGAFTTVLPKTVSVQVGDGVFVPGPGALLVGTVAKLQSEASSPSVTLLITPVINPFSITWVLVKDVGNSFLLGATSTRP